METKEFRALVLAAIAPHHDPATDGPLLLATRENGFPRHYGRWLTYTEYSATVALWPADGEADYNGQPLPGGEWLDSPTAAATALAQALRRKRLAEKEEATYYVVGEAYQVQPEEDAAADAAIAYAKEEEAYA